LIFFYITMIHCEYVKNILGENGTIFEFEAEPFSRAFSWLLLYLCREIKYI